MFLSLGRSTAAPDDVVALLLACHERIRSFVAIARLAATREASDEEVVQALARVERYFEEALPLHVADEEESLVPRLRGRDRELEEALEAMRAQHAEHDAALVALLGASASLRERPRDEERRRALAAAAERLEAAFAEHLALEERVVFPAIRRLLSPEVQREVVRELRARRRE